LRGEDGQYGRQDRLFAHERSAPVRGYLREKRGARTREGN